MNPKNSQNQWEIELQRAGKMVRLELVFAHLKIEIFVFEFLVSGRVTPFVLILFRWYCDVWSMLKKRGPGGGGMWPRIQRAEELRHRDVCGGVTARRRGVEERSSWWGVRIPQTMSRFFNPYFLLSLLVLKKFICTSGRLKSWVNVS